MKKDKRSNVEKLLGMRGRFAYHSKPLPKPAYGGGNIWLVPDEQENWKRKYKHLARLLVTWYTWSEEKYGPSKEIDDEFFNQCEILSRTPEQDW